jgi:signal transduction histidine kinase
MEKLRLRISKDLHDELGSSLTGVAIRADLINEQIDQETKNKFLNEISIQSRSAVDSLSDIVWALDSTNNSIQDLYDRMESILFKLLTPLKISYSFTPYEVNKYLGLKPDYKQHLFLIFKEAVTNIVKHSNATNVDVTITKERRKLKLKIHDNGTNFKNEKNSLNGYGIKNMKSRADKIKGELKITVKDGFIIELWFDYLTQKPT